VEKAKRVFSPGDVPPAIQLARLSRLGWLDRWARGTYRVVHPLVCMREMVATGWRDRVPQKDRLPILELAVARIFEEFGSGLRSLVLFGSLARGAANEESDIDLLLVADGLPESYDKRLSMIRSILSFEPIEKWRNLLWKERGIYPLIEVISLSAEEALTTHPFYLDMTESAIMIYDREMFFARKLGDLRARLEEIGAFKSVLPSGQRFWVLAKDASAAEKLVL
jgi:uncharacterized protein